MLGDWLQQAMKAEDPAAEYERLAAGAVKKRRRGLIIAAIMGIGGYILLAYVDWRIAVGVFAIHWLINVRMREV